MKLTKSKDYNPNYLAKIVYVDNFRPHPNADKLKLCTVDGCNISTSIDSKEGVYVYFPLECAINTDFLKINNLYRKSDMNQDSTKSGFFEEAGRVKCIKLRGLPSEGIIMPIESIFSFIKEKPSNLETLIGTEFDTINEIKFVWKYVIYTNKASILNKNKQSSKQLNIMDGQFHFHVDTIRLEKVIDRIHPNDLIQISWKEHGTSAIFCNLLTAPNYSIGKKLINKISKKIFKHSVFPEYEYHQFCSSRKVIKDNILNPTLSKGYYSYDIWNLAFDIVKPFIQKGMTLYAEIVGYIPDGKMIQKDYDYKCIYEPKIYSYEKMTPRKMYDAKLFDIIVYRITYTNIDGKVYEWSTQQIKEFCKTCDLHSVKELYYGLAKDLFPTLKNIKGIYWNQNFVDNLRSTYLERNSILCNNKVPEEGIVIRRETNIIDVYKLKAFAFLQRESSELDKGTIDIESDQ